MGELPGEGIKIDCFKLMLERIERKQIYWREGEYYKCAGCKTLKRVGQQFCK
jgi:hypothetical protein